MERKDLSRHKNICLDRAVQLWQLEHSKPKPLSLKDICERIKKEYFDETGQHVNLSDSTLERRTKGGRSMEQAGEETAWLGGAEVKEVIGYMQECSGRGFPLNHKRIKEHVDEIGRAKWGDKFPEKGVGKQWTTRFVSDHHDEIQSHWSRLLDRKRARAVNPATKKVFFDMVEHVVKGEGGEDIIPDELKYGGDETGLQEGVGQSGKVFGKKGKKTQHQERSGNRENITVMVTICADGSTLEPAVIYKGKGFRTQWKQNNPANAS